MLPTLLLVLTHNIEWLNIRIYLFFKSWEYKHRMTETFNDSSSKVLYLNKHLSWTNRETVGGNMTPKGVQFV